MARELRNAGVRLRVVSRRADSLEDLFGTEEDERVPADALDGGGVLRAVDGCPLVFDCIGLPSDLMHQHPATARNIAGAVRQTGARCVQISSFWAYLPVTNSVISEEHPRTGGDDWVRYRREAEDILQQAGAAILHLPDFYGPWVHTSTLQQPLHQAAEGKTMNWIGSTSTEREYIYVPDAMRIAARTAKHSAAYGERWILPGSGPLSGKRAAAIAGEVLGSEVKVAGAGPLLLRLVSLFHKPLRGFLQMVPDYVKPISYDASKLRGLLAELRITPYEEGFAKTLAWLRQKVK